MMYNAGTGALIAPLSLIPRAMEVAMELTQSYLKTLLHYNPVTGIFTWRYRPRSMFNNNAIYVMTNNRCNGKKIGSYTRKGYLETTVNSQKILVHRMAFLYMGVEIPEGMQVDHINGVKDDNRWSNLRLVRSQDNQRNMKVNIRNKSGTPGVSWDKSKNRWVVFIYDRGPIFVGRYKQLEDAVRARKAAERKHNYHENHGRL